MSDRNQIIEELLERSAHGTQREDIEAAFDAGRAYETGVQIVPPLSASDVVALALSGDGAHVDGLRFELATAGLKMHYLYKGRVIVSRDFGYITFTPGSCLEISGLDARLQVDFR